MSGHTGASQGALIGQETTKLCPATHGQLQRVLLGTRQPPMKVALHSSYYLVEANNRICHSKDQIDVLLREFLSHQAQRGIVLGMERGYTLGACTPNCPGPHHALQPGLDHLSQPMVILNRSSGIHNSTHGSRFTSVVEAE